MVFVTVVSNTNPSRVFLDNPVNCISKIRLVSCSLYNSWRNLESPATVSLFDSSNPPVLTHSLNLAPGHMTIENVAYFFKDISETYNLNLVVEVNGLLGAILIRNPSKKVIKLSENFADFLGFVGANKTVLQEINWVKELNCPKNYFVHCNFINIEKNFLNGKKSDLLAGLKVKGKSFESVDYVLPVFNFKETTVSNNRNELVLSVKKLDGGLFDFQGLEITYEIELI